MNQQAITLVAALIAAITSIGNAGVSYLASSSLEQERIQNSRKEQARTKLRGAVEAFSQEIGDASQRAVWLLWKSAKGPDLFSMKDINDYESSISEIMPRILTSKLLVAAHNVDVYSALTRLEERFNGLDAEISLAVYAFQRSREAGLEKLAPLYQRSIQFHSDLTDDLARILTSESAKAEL